MANDRMMEAPIPQHYLGAVKKEEEQHQHQQPEERKEPTVDDSPTKRKKIGRSKSTGVRRILTGQWSQRLTNHLKNKLEKGPSTHEPKIFDGEASNPNLLAQIAEGEPPQDRHNLSSTRLEQSITGDIEAIASSWLLSPKRSPKNSAVNNNNSNSSLKNSNYNNLDSGHGEDNHNDNATTHSTTKSYSDSKSLLFPPPPGTGSSSTLFNGVNDFLNMSSGPIPAVEMGAKDEFAIVRQIPARQSSNKSPSRLSIFGNKSRPALAPNLAKQLTDFRLRRQGKQPKKDAAEDDKDGTEHFSVTTEKLSGHTSGHIESDEDVSTSSSSLDEGEGDLDPAKSPITNNKAGKNSHVRRLNAAGEFQHVENMLSSQRQRFELTNEIEWRREKFKNKLAAAANAVAARAKDNSATATTGHDSKDFAKDLQETLLGSDHIAEMAAGTKDIDLRLAALTQKVTNTGSRPRRAQSASAGSRMSRSSSLPEALDKQAAVKAKKSSKSRKISILEDVFDDDDSVFFGNKAGGKKQISTTERTTISSSAHSSSQSESSAMDLNHQSFPPPPQAMGARLIRSSASSSSESNRRRSMSTAGSATPNEKESSTRSHRTSVSARSERSGSSQSERTSLSTGKAASDTASTIPRGNGSLRSQRTSGSAGAALVGKEEKIRRRATVAAIDFENSFQITEGVLEFADPNDHEEDSSSKSNKKKGKNPKKQFEEVFTSKADKDTTTMFHESFSFDSLVSPRRKKRNSGGSMPNMMAESPNLMEASFSLLSTVEEISRCSRDEPEERRPRRRNSLPTGSSHGPDVNDLFPTGRIAGKSRAAKSGEPNSVRPGSSRRGQRHSVSTEMGASINQLRLELEAAGTGILIAKSMASSITSGSKDAVEGEDELQQIVSAATKFQGIAPSKADAQTSRRRASVKVEPMVKPEPRETTVDKIRMRRRTNARTAEKASLKQRPSMITRAQSTPTESASSPINDAADANATQRRRDRKARRHTSQGHKEKASDGLKRSMTHDVASHKPEDALKRTVTHDGTASAAAASHDETRKKTTRSLTPKSRRSRRRANQAESSPAAPKTPTARTERVRRNSISDGTSLRSTRTPIFNEATTARVRGARGLDESPASQPSRTTPVSLRRIARPKLQSSMDETGTKSDKSDDGSLEPTPKPVAPPTLPMLPTRGRSKSPEGGLFRRSTKPRRHKSDSVGPKMDESKSRRQTSDAPSPGMDESDIVTPSGRRKTRNRRHTVHEALKDNEVEVILSPGPSSKKRSGESPEVHAALAVPSLSEKEAKARRTMDKKLMAELCRSPNKTNRFRRRKSHDDEAGATKDDALKSPKPSRRFRKSSSDEGADKDAKSPYRRRRADTGGVATPIRSRLRRVKTADSVSVVTDTPLDEDTKIFMSARNDEADKDTLERVASQKMRSDTPTPQQADATVSGRAITNKTLLNGLSF